MAVHGDDEAGAQPANTDAVTRTGLGQPAQQQQRQQEQAAPAGPGFTAGISGIPGRMKRLMTRSGYGEVAKKYAESIRLLLKEEIEKEAVKVMILDSQAYMCALSCVVVLGVQVRGTQQFVSAHTLIIEESGGRLPKRQFNYNGKPLEITTVAGDVYNAAMQDKIKQLCASAYPNAKVLLAGAQVVPREIKTDDYEHLRAKVFQACEAVVTKLEHLTGDRVDPFSVSWLDLRQDKLISSVDFNPPQLFSTDGLPVRNDFNVRLSGQTFVKQDDLHSPNMEFTSVSGYVDLVYTQPQVQAGYGAQPVTQLFTPRLVLTDIETLLPATGLEQTLLALASTTLLSHRYLWAGVFKPKFGGNQQHRNIGALGLDFPALVNSTDGRGDFIDTQDPTFTMDSLFQLISYCANADVVYSMDIDEAGPKSWMQLIFIAACEPNNPNFQKANDALLSAANTLTNGAFARNFQCPPGSNPVIYDDRTRIHIGYYKDEAGQLNDLRKIDYIAMLNQHGKKDKDACIEWANTFDRIDEESDVRLERREKMTNNMLEGTERIVGYARRVTIMPHFMKALILGLEQSGLTIQPQNAQIGFAEGKVRGVQNINSLSFNGNVNLFNYVSGNQGGFRGTQSAATRWS